MSSYNFVNSLACYSQPQLGQQQSHPANNNNSSTTSAATGQSGNSEYFSSSAYTPNLYPNTPQAHYGNQYNLGGQQTPADMVDYTQLQPQRLLLPNQQQQQQQSAQQPPLNANSCKYASATDNISTNNNNTTAISSPQDLTTGRDLSPKLSPNSVVESVARSLNKNATGAVSSTNQSNNPLGVNVNHTTVPLSMHSPNGGDSDSSDESGNEAGGSSQNSSGKKGTPPQIYPWMKRVHLGQSEYFFFLFAYPFPISPAVCSNSTATAAI